MQLRLQLGSWSVGLTVVPGPIVRDTGPLCILLRVLRVTFDLPRGSNGSLESPRYWPTAGIGARSKAGVRPSRTLCDAAYLCG